MLPSDNPAVAGFSFSELCKILGKDAVYVRNLQRLLDLHIPGKDHGYSQNYLIFMEKIVALRSFHVPQDEIKELFDTEKKIMRLLHADTLTDSPTWYLDGCGGSEEDEAASSRLLFGGYRLDFPLPARTVQHTLDFGPRAPELFKGSEMGEDLRRVMQKYHGLVNALRERIAREKPVLENALHWARGFLKRDDGA